MRHGGPSPQVMRIVFLAALLVLVIATRKQCARGTAALFGTIGGTARDGPPERDGGGTAHTAHD
jgi:hypothetical protein